MESAKLRLIILGALRGLIRPGYDQGINSVIREELLVRALGREIDGEAMISRGLLESSIVSVSDPAHRSKIHQQAIRFLMQGNALMNLMPPQEISKANIDPSEVREIQRIGALLKVLKRTDFCDRMAAVLKAR